MKLNIWVRAAVVSMASMLWVPITQAQNSQLRVGESAIAVDSAKQVVVIGAQSNGWFVVRDSNGNIYSNVSRSNLAVMRGCSSDLCAGDRIVAVDSAREMTVVAIQSNGWFVVRDRNGNTYTNISSSNLARTNSCSGNLCVNQSVIAVDSAKEMIIVAVQTNGWFVVRDRNGNTYSNVSASNLAPMSGCYGNLCVGQVAIAINSGKTVTVIALQSNGWFVVRDQNGNTYTNISGSNLASTVGRVRPPRRRR